LVREWTGGSQDLCHSGLLASQLTGLGSSLGLPFKLRLALRSTL
jgi:hypothetical protein